MEAWQSPHRLSYREGLQAQATLVATATAAAAAATASASTTAASAAASDDAAASNAGNVAAALVSGTDDGYFDLTAYLDEHG